MSNLQRTRKNGEESVKQEKMGIETYYGSVQGLYHHIHPHQCPQSPPTCRAHLIPLQRTINQSLVACHSIPRRLVSADEAPLVHRCLIRLLPLSIKKVENTSTSPDHRGRDRNQSSRAFERTLNGHHKRRTSSSVSSSSHTSESSFGRRRRDRSINGDFKTSRRRSSISPDPRGRDVNFYGKRSNRRTRSRSYSRDRS